MSEDQTKKPKDIKDLKSRLGKAAAPAGAPVPPGGVVPGFGGAAAPPASIAPPPAMGTPSIPVAPGAPVVAPPSFLAPAASAAPAVAAKPAARAASSDPFASAAAPAASAGPREVRLVIDEKPVDDAEIGRKQQNRVISIIAIGLVVGLLLGYIGGSVMGDRKIYNRAVRDGNDIYASVRAAEERVTKAQTLIDQIASKARPTTPGQRPAIDFAALEQLRSLEKPFNANAFVGKSYNAFRADTVNSLFEYQTGVTTMWEKILFLVNRSLSQSARTELTNAAAAAGEISTTTYGLVPRAVGDNLIGSLVFVDPPAPGANNAPPTKVAVRASRGGQAGEKTIFNGTQSLEGDAAMNHVILVDGPSSAAVVGQAASAYADFARSITELKALSDSTVETQGRLMNGLSEVTRNHEVFAF